MGIEKLFDGSQREEEEKTLMDGSQKIRWNIENPLMFHVPTK